MKKACPSDLEQRAAQSAATPLASVMNSRRFIADHAPDALSPGLSDFAALVQVVVVRSGSNSETDTQMGGPHCPQQRTSSARPVRSEECQDRKWAARIPRHDQFDQNQKRAALHDYKRRYVGIDVVRSNITTLTPREREVFELVIRGKTNMGGTASLMGRSISPAALRGTQNEPRVRKYRDLAI